LAEAGATMVIAHIAADISEVIRAGQHRALGLQADVGDNGRS
jgi:hypothetical protein